MKGHRGQARKTVSINLCFVEAWWQASNEVVVGEGAHALAVADSAVNRVRQINEECFVKLFKRISVDGDRNWLGYLARVERNCATVAFVVRSGSRDTIRRGV